jgi:flagellar assembly protein FliH
MGRNPRARVKLIRIHTPHPVGGEGEGAGGDTFTPLHEPFAAGEAPCGVVLAAPDPAEALEEAYARGIAEGQRGAEAEFQAALEGLRAEGDQRIAALTGGISEQMKALQVKVENDAYRFALAVAERIIRHEILLTDDVVIAQIKDAMQRIVGVESIKLRVHPTDEPVVSAHRATFLASLGNLRDLVIEADDSMERGGCIIESASGNVDARISTQLRQIETALFGARQPDGDPAP